MDEAEQKLKAVNDAIQGLATLLAPEGAMCTTWILITEWIDSDGNFWFSSHTEPEQPVWKQIGMVDHAKSVMKQRYESEVMRNDDGDL